MPLFPLPWLVPLALHHQCYVVLGCLIPHLKWWHCNNNYITSTSEADHRAQTDGLFGLPVFHFVVIFRLQQQVYDPYPYATIPYHTMWIAQRTHMKHGTSKLTRANSELPWQTPGYPGKHWNNPGNLWSWTECMSWSAAYIPNAKQSRTHLFQTTPFLLVSLNWLLHQDLG